MRRKSRYMKMHRLAILAALLGSCYASWSIAPVHAQNSEHILAVTVPSDYVNSQMGAVYGSRVTTNVNFEPGVGIIKNLNRDPATYPYRNHKGKSGFALRQYTYSTIDVKNTEIYAIDHTNLVKEYDGVLENVANMHGCGSNDDYFINTGYDLGRVAICRYEGKKLVEVNKNTPTDLIVDIRKNASEALEGFNENTQAHGEGILVKGDNVYVLTNINPNNDWETYLDGFVVHYKIENGGNLKYKSYGRVGKNTDSGRLNLYNNKIFVSSIGGMQNYGWANTQPDSHTAIHAITLDSKQNLDCKPDANKNEVVLPANATWMNNNPNASDFHDMKVLPDGTAYIYGYFLNPSSAGSTSHIYKTTVSNLLTKNPENWEEIKSGPIEGWFGKVYAEYYTKRLWLEYGNDLLVYTDGAAEPTKVWAAKDFSTNKAYYQFNSVTALDPDTVTGEKTPLYVSKPYGMGTYTLQIPTKAENPDAILKKATYINKITGTSADTAYAGTNATNDYSNYTFTKEIVIRPPLTLKVDGVRIPVVGDLTTNVMACVDGHAGNDVVIHAGQNKLWLHAKNYIGNPTGIYAGRGKNVTVTAGAVNIITKGYEGGNTLTNAIWNDAPATGSSNITINAPVNICMSGGYGGNGIAVTKTNRWGEASYEAASPSIITINGDVKIAGEDTQTWGIPVNEENVFSRFNNAALLTSVKHGEINVNGKVDFAVYGNGAAVNAEDSKINIGSGTIVVPKNMKYGYYSLAAYQGTINMNTDSRYTGDVKLDGGLFALPGGVINANLTTGNSYLNGIIDNAGTVNLHLRNGAQWTNREQNSRYSQDDEDAGSKTHSKLTKLTGGSTDSESGHIYQRSDKEIRIGSYQGTEKVYFGHSASAPSAIWGGAVRITTAEPGSRLHLITDNCGIDMSDNTAVQATLEALANKLYYTGYAENHLSSWSEIAEGLTTSSAILKSSALKYKPDSGQGTLQNGGPEPPVPEVTGIAITGSPFSEDAYAQAGIFKNGQYKFLTNPGVIRTEEDAAISAKIKNLTIKGSNDGAGNLDLSAAHTGIKASSAKAVVLTAGKVLLHDVKTGIVAAGVDSRVILQGAAEIKASERGIESKNGGIVDIASGHTVSDRGVLVDRGILYVRNNGTPAGLTTPVLTVKNGGKAQVAGNIAADTIEVAGKPSDGSLPSRMYILNDKADPAPITTSAKRITLQNSGVLRASAGTEVSATESVTIGDGRTTSILNAKGRFNSRKGLTVKGGSKGFLNGGGSLQGRLEAEGAGAYLYSHEATIGNKDTESSVIARKGGKLQLNGRKILNTKLEADNGRVNVRDGHYALGAVTAKNQGNVYLTTSQPGSLKGAITSTAGGNVTLQLNGNGSTLTGNWQGDGVVNVTLGAASSWEGNSEVKRSRLTLGENSRWQNRGQSEVGYLSGRNSVLDMTSDKGGDVYIGNYAGSTTVLYRHDSTAPQNSQSGMSILGGRTTVNRAAKDSRITLLTDHAGINTNDKKLVNATLNNLAGKLFYKGYELRNETDLQGVVKIAEGLTAQSAAMATGAISYKANGQGQFTGSATINGNAGGRNGSGTAPLRGLQSPLCLLSTAGGETVASTSPSPLGSSALTSPAKELPPQAVRGTSQSGSAPAIIYGNKETVMMRGSKSAMTAATLLWRGNNNDLQRRMGDVRLGKEDSGIWARYLGGKNELDQPKTTFKQTYNLAQVGYDKKVGDWMLGIAVDYGTGNDTYASGTGKEKLGSLALYGTRQSKDGAYLDLIARSSRVKNDYTVYNEMGHKLEGDYKTWGMSFSAEYGKRFVQGNGFYIDPSIELTAGHLNGKDYDAVSDYTGNKKMHVQQDGVNSVIGRLGLGVGYETATSNLFAKVALAHEFGGKIRSTFSAVGEPTSSTEVDLKDTWLDLELGGSWQVNKGTYLYGTFTRNFGAPLKSNWRVDAGVRWTF